MNQFARGGDFCPNETCIDYGKLRTEATPSLISKF